jgi:TetR/AcrR family transcriptional regulator, transcriptional repressor for nem operon
MAAKGLETRERILATAEPMVLRQGFAGTSLDDLVKATGLTKGAFFHHFKGKAELAKALVERYAENDYELFERLAAEADDRSGDPLDSVIIFLRLFESVIEGRTEAPAGCVFAAYTHERQQFDASVHAFVAKSLKRWTTLYEAKFGLVLACYKAKIAIAAHELAEMIVAIIEGGFILSRSYGDAHLVARQSRQFRNYLELLFGDREPQSSAQG